MSRLVATSEEDPALAVLRFVSDLAWADAGPEVAEAQVARLCVEAQQYMLISNCLDLVSLILTSAQPVSSKLSDKDLDCVFTVISNLVTKSESPHQVLDIAKLISANIAQHPNHNPALRLNLLFNLYNLLDHPNARFHVYLTALTLAIQGKVTHNLTHSFNQIDSLLKDWNIGVADQRTLFLTIISALKENKSAAAKESFKFQTKYLETFSVEDALTLNEAKEEAVNTIIDFVKAPDMFQCDLLDLPAIRQLEKDAKHALVYQLLRIFLTQRLDAYLDFQAANSALLKDFGLVHEDCVTKMRMMSLMDLGSDESGLIPYSLVKDTLRINDDEVELWVVKAIAAKLMDCKMDQLNKVVSVSRSTERVFGHHQWQSLRTKLATWRNNVAGVINTIQANKVTEDSTQAMQGLAIR